MFQIWQGAFVYRAVQQNKTNSEFEIGNRKGDRMCVPLWGRARVVGQLLCSCGIGRSAHNLHHGKPFRRGLGRRH